MRANQSGFTMIELMMVIVLVGILNAVALPSFIDFRREAKGAATQKALQTIRIGVKNQVMQAKLRCNSVQTNFTISSTYYANFYTAAVANSITTGGICTTTQVSNAADRKFFDGGMPANPFAKIQSPVVVTVVPYVSQLYAVCDLADYFASSGLNYHWVVEPVNGGVWAATNTAGVSECNYN